eukprot:2377714-Amphidinium_carterae.2
MRRELTKTNINLGRELEVLELMRRLRSQCFGVCVCARVMMNRLPMPSLDMVARQRHALLLIAASATEHNSQPSLNGGISSHNNTAIRGQKAWGHPSIKHTHISLVSAEEDLTTYTLLCTRRVCT